MARDISGVWVFNGTVVTGGTSAYDAHFISNNQSFSQMRVTTYHLYFDGTLVYNSGINEWLQGDEFRIVDFGSEPQSIPDTLYYFLVANATQQTCVRYKGEIISPLDNGQIAALKCSGKKMGSDVVIQAQPISDITDVSPNYGARKSYDYAFAYTNFTTIRPKDSNNNPVIVKPTSTLMNMFSRAMWLKEIKADCFNFSAADTDNTAAKGLYHTFSYCPNLEIIEDLQWKPGYYYYTFSNCMKLKTIGRIATDENTPFNAAFGNCFALENIVIDGVIGQKGFNVSHSTRLTHESLMSIINALKDFSGTDTTKTVTLGTENQAKLTDAEKAIATQKGWTIA